MGRLKKEGVVDTSFFDREKRRNVRKEGLGCYFILEPRKAGITNLSLCSLGDSSFQGMIAHLSVTYVLGQCVTHVLGSYPRETGTKKNPPESLDLT